MASGNRPKSKRVAKPHLSERKLRELLRPFRTDVTARPPPSRPVSTATRRTATTASCEPGSPRPARRRVPSRGGRGGRELLRGGAREGRARSGARGKAIVFGPLKRGGKVHAQIVPDASGKTSTRVIEGKAPKGSAMCADGLPSYDGPVDWDYRHRHRVRRGEDELVERGDPGSHIAGIGSLWGLAKSRLAKYQGIAKGDFSLHLRERELGFNMRGRDIYRFLLSELRRRPLNKASPITKYTGHGLQKIDVTPG